MRGIESQGEDGRGKREGREERNRGAVRVGRGTLRKEGGEV